MLILTKEVYQFCSVYLCFECYYFLLLFTVTVIDASLFCVCMCTLRGQPVKAWCVHTDPWVTAVFSFGVKDYTNSRIVQLKLTVNYLK